jgi:hypothetical protein
LIHRKSTNYGHFDKDNADLAREATDKAAAQRPDSSPCMTVFYPPFKFPS